MRLCVSVGVKTSESRVRIGRSEKDTFFQIWTDVFSLLGFKITSKFKACQLRAAERHRCRAWLVLQVQLTRVSHVGKQKRNNYTFTDS